jgi:hypothetical protein
VDAYELRPLLGSPVRPSARSAARLRACQSSGPQLAALLGGTWWLHITMNRLLRSCEGQHSNPGKEFDDGTHQASVNKTRIVPTLS